MAISPVAIFGAWYFSYSATTASTETSKAYAKAGGTASESLSELRTIAALGAEAKQADKYAGSLGQARDAGIRKSYRCGFANGLLFSSGNLMAAAGFLYGASKIKRVLENTFVEGKKQYELNGDERILPWVDSNGRAGANCANGEPGRGNFICVHMHTTMPTCNVTASAAPRIHAYIGHARVRITDIRIRVHGRHLDATVLCLKPCVVSVEAI
jgi:ABC-type multidrug transport system fused ATPase/permease subunit